MGAILLQAHKLTSYNLGEYPCHPFLGSSQYYTISKIGAFRNEYMCGQVQESRNNNEKEASQRCARGVFIPMQEFLAKNLHCDRMVGGPLFAHQHHLHKLFHVSISKQIKSA